MILGLSIGGNAGILAHGIGSGVVGGKRQACVAELGQHHREIACRSVQVLSPVIGVNAKCAGGIRHQLPKTDGPGVGDGARIVSALDLDIGAIKVQPIRDGNVGGTQSTVACIAQTDLLDRAEKKGAKPGWP